MKFLKKLFSKKARKEETAPAPVVAEETASLPMPAEEPKPVDTRMDALKPRLTPEGNYVLNLDVNVLGKNNGQVVHMVTCRDNGFQMALFSPQFLSGVKEIAVNMEDHMNKHYGFDVGQVYYKRKDANFYFDGYDQLLGLPPGDGFQMVLVPEGSDWRPPFSPAPRYAIPGTNTILQHPATLLPQFQPQVTFPIMFVNGMDILTPTLPAMPKAEEKKPEEKPAGDAVAQPAAAPPPPSAPKM